MWRPDSSPYRISAPTSLVGPVNGPVVTSPATSGRNISLMRSTGQPVRNGPWSQVQPQHRSQPHNERSLQWEKRGRPYNLPRWLSVFSLFAGCDIQSQPAADLVVHPVG